MRYRAVLDVDGNSWSGRFSKLLCYNSVVILVRIKDDYEGYFMADLMPGVHYLPASLENFTEVAKWAVQNSSLPEIKQIVQNANAWCSQKIHADELNRDFLALLNGYVQGLNANDPNWIDKWKNVQDSYLGTSQYQVHDGFTSDLRGRHKEVFLATPDMPGLVVTNLSQMTEIL